MGPSGALGRHRRAPHRETDAVTVGEQEQGSAPPTAPPASSRARALRVVIAAIAVLAVVAALLAWRSATADTDGDGLTDRTEASGWRTADGTVYRTDPDRADSDGDGLTDLDEAGSASADGVYAGYSDPLAADTDVDTLGDAGEADAGLDPRDADVDDDGLRDGYELDVTGTDPESADTDGDTLTDAYEDANRATQGLDPLSPDEQISAADYAADFAKGAAGGELAPGDSLAWLAGNLASGFVPGGIADVRDAVGSALKGDWVGSGFNVLGALPGGDAVSAERKVVKFLAKHPRLAVEVASLIAKASVIPEAVRLATIRTVWPDWDRLVTAGADEKALLKLQQGRSDLAQLAEAQLRKTHISGTPLKPLRSGAEARERILDLYAGANKAAAKGQRFSTSACDECDGGIRVGAVVVDRVLHEVKVGYVPLTRSVERQIRKDSWLIRTGALDGAQWHFVASDLTSTLGADPRVLDLLDEAGITYTIHLPAAS